MKVGLYIEKNNFLVGEIYASLLINGIDAVPNLDVYAKKVILKD
jgi:hypothetical protein